MTHLKNEYWDIVRKFAPNAPELLPEAFQAAEDASPSPTPSPISKITLRAILTAWGVPSRYMEHALLSPQPSSALLHAQKLLEEGQGLKTWSVVLSGPFGCGK